jgi:hypothetical protein
MWHGKNDVVVRRWEQISHPFVFFERTAQKTVPVATTVILSVRMQTVLIVAPVTMIPQRFGVAGSDLG